jgi:three-Cys-motif partner protein
MSNSDDHFGEFEPHSEFKHLVLLTYFDMWGRKLLLRPSAGSTVLYVDACAGRGMDDQGNHGSPVLIAKAAAKAAGQVGELRQLPVRVQVVAIEKNAGNFAALVKNLAPFKTVTRALRGTLPEHFDSIQEEFSAVPTLYFLDPFGLKPLDGKTIRRALSGDKKEVLVLFADQAALRHVGAATSQMTKTELKLAALNPDLELFPQVVEDERLQLQPKAERSKKAQTVTRERAIEILDCAFDGHGWFAVIDPLPAHERRKAFVQLYSDFLKNCGAQRVLPFPVIDADGSHRYYLLHASPSPKGYSTMKEAIEYALKHGPLGPDIAAMVRDELKCDVESVESLVRLNFAGAQIRWAEDPNNKLGPSVRAFALENTPMMPSQLDELKQRLATVRVPKTGNTVLYDFPKIADHSR